MVTGMDSEPLGVQCVVLARLSPAELFATGFKIFRVDITRTKYDGFACTGRRNGVVCKF